MYEKAKTYKFRKSTTITNREAKESLLNKEKIVKTPKTLEIESFEKF